MMQGCRTRGPVASVWRRDGVARATVLPSSLSQPPSHASQPLARRQFLRVTHALPTAAAWTLGPRGCTAGNLASGAGLRSGNL